MPYGILYFENDECYVASALLCQRKYGSLRKVKIAAVCCSSVVMLALIYLPNFFFNTIQSRQYMPTMLTFDLAALLIIPIYLFVSRKQAANLAKLHLMTGFDVRSQRQLVLRENDMELTSAYSKASYPYNEILACYESPTEFTVVFDRNAYHICVPKLKLSAQQYTELSQRLRYHLGSKYETVKR